MTRPVFRFAPSPNGDLHLGHAYSALLNGDLAARTGGRLLVRIEDIDGDRSRPAFIARILQDLDWLGVDYEHPVRRQSEHVDLYRAAVDRLATMGLVYPSFASRAEIRAAVETAESASRRSWPRDPDGSPLMPPLDRNRHAAETAARIAAGEPHALRLRMDEATRLAGALSWSEAVDPLDPATAFRTEVADPAAWGDIVLARKDAPASYHVAVVVDDAVQGITDVVRGRDLFHATAIHRLLQTLLGPGIADYIGACSLRYRHHDLILGPDGRKLSKSLKSTALRSLREEGATPADVRRFVGLGPAPSR